MRVAIVTESYRPDVNGVSHSVQRVVEHLLARGHAPVVVAPESDTVAADDPCPVVRVPSVPLPGYPAFRIGLPSRRVEATLRGADVVHLASPFALAAHGAYVADRLGIPSVAVYQTDVASFAAFYRFGAGRAAAWRWLRRVHTLAHRTLAPSSPAVADLRAHGVPSVYLWPRGVDSERFHPSRRVRPTGHGEVVVGYVGRLAPEKQVELLEPVTRLPGVRVVVVGDGPSRRALERLMPRAEFTGELRGDALARAFANLDVFVYTGPHETFCQTVQEALASGVPVVAPAAGGPVNLVRHGRSGYLVEPGNPDAVASAVAVLVADPALRILFGLEARGSVARRTWAAVGDALLDHYAAVVAGAGVIRAA
ncbi:MAG TPA: glycosyltransferase family 1 protein [Mycobacteriales bacterium]|jgi:phosphatidylinositol alpha 1,6-mannosyltransferase